MDRRTSKSPPVLHDIRRGRGGSPGGLVVVVVATKSEGKTEGENFCTWMDW